MSGQASSLSQQDCCCSTIAIRHLIDRTGCIGSKRGLLIIAVSRVRPLSAFLITHRCLIYELATGLPPFTAANQVALARKVVTEDAPLLPPSFSRDLQQLLRAMLRKAPEDRLSVDMVLGHPAVSACARRLSEERRAASREQELPPQPKQPQEKWTPAAMQRKFEEQLLEAKQEMEREYEVRLRNVVDTAAQKSAAEHRERESERLVESEKQIRELTGGGEPCFLTCVGSVVLKRGATPDAPFAAAVDMMHRAMQPTAAGGAGGHERKDGVGLCEGLRREAPGEPPA